MPAWEDYRERITTVTAAATTEAVLAALPIPAGDAVAGTLYRLFAWGTMDIEAALIAPVCTMRMRLGGVGGTLLATRALTGPTLTARTGAPWQADLRLMCVTSGSGATWHGLMTIQSDLPVLGSATQVPMGASASPVTRSALAASDLVLTSQWDAAHAGRVVRMNAGFSEKRWPSGA